MQLRDTLDGSDEKNSVAADVTSNHSEHIGQCKHGSKNGCLVALPTIKPNLDGKNRKFKSDISEATATTLSIDGKAHDLKATGSYSVVKVGLMWGKNKFNNKDLSHWGLVLIQEKTWYIDEDARKCLLIHHMGQGVEIAIGCLNCVRTTVRDVYPLTCTNPNIKFYDFGKSTATFHRFLSEKSLCRNVNYKYNTAFAKKKKDKFYDWGETNCMRIVFDLLLFLKLDYRIAVSFTAETDGNQKWNQVFEEVASKKENEELLLSIYNMWTDMKSKEDLNRVVKLVDGQYHLDMAQEMFKAKFLLTMFGRVFNTE